MTRVSAPYPARCPCGCGIEPGDVIEYAAGRIAGCKGCAWTGERRRADAIRARHNREARKRAREDGHGR